MPETFDPQAAHQQAMRALQRHDLTEAERLYRRIAGERPDDHLARFYLAQVLERVGRVREALSLAEHVMHDVPEQASVAAFVAHLRRRAGRLKDAIDAAIRARDLAPTDPAMRLHLGELYERAQRFDEAEASLRDAKDHAPGHPKILAWLSRLLRRRQDIDGAMTVLDSVRLETGTIDDQYAYHKERAQVLHARRAYGDAWSALGDAAKISRRRQRAADADPSYLPGVIDAYRSMMRRGAFAEACRAIDVRTMPAGPTRLVFVVGPPRSGTTMIGQVLNAHPAILTLDERNMLGRTLHELAGEQRRSPASLVAELDRLDDATIAKGREIYLRHLRAEITLNDPPACIVDKNPGNLIHAPLVNRLFPEMPMLIMQRDPRDVCLSAYMQTFAINALTTHFGTWDDTVRFYVGMMDAWHSVRTGLTMPTIRVPYENLVRHFEEMARAIIEALGVEWHDSVLTFNTRTQAVSTPSYGAVTTAVTDASIGRWMQYAQHFEAVSARLQPFIDAYGAEVQA